MLPFKTRRTSQPQGAVEIDWGHPHVGRPFSVVHAPSKTEVVRGVALQQSAQAASVASRFGLGLDTAAGYALPPISGGPYAERGPYAYSTTSGVSGNFSVLTVVHWPLAVAGGAIWQLGSATQGAAIWWGVQFSGERTYLILEHASSTTHYTDISSFVAAGDTFSISFSYTLSTDAKVTLCNLSTGVQSAEVSFTTTSALYEGFVTDAGNTQRVGTAGTGLHILLEARWRSVLSAQSASVLTRNPWQLFKPQARSLWIPGTVSGGSSHTLTGANSTQSSASGTGAVSQSHLLTGASCSQSATSGTGAITQGATHILTGANSTQAALSGTGVITQGHMLVGANSTQAAASGTGAIIAGAVHILAAANASQSATSSAAAITQRHTLISAPSVQDSIASASAIVQRHMLGAAACSQTAVSGVGAIIRTAPGAAVYPLASQVLAGVQYGPTGADYVGTLTGGSGPSAADIAAAVRANLMAELEKINSGMLSANVKQINSVNLTGNGKSIPWGAE